MRRDIQYLLTAVVVVVLAEGLMRLFGGSALEPAFRVVSFLVLEIGPITLVCLLGMLALFVLLPRPRNYPWLFGAFCAALALLLAGLLLVRAGAVTPETVLFYAFSLASLVSGGLLVTQSNPARAALSFALVVLSTCGLFLLLAAPFLMAATIIVYAGAIVVIFLFVLMLAQQDGATSADHRSREPFLASLTGFVLLGTLLFVLGQTYDTRALDGLVTRAEAMIARLDALPPGPAGRESGRELLGVNGEGRQLIREFQEESKRFVLPDDRARLRHAAENADWDEPEGLKASLDRLIELGREASRRRGELRPAEGNQALSGLSGPPPNVEPRRGPSGAPHLPSENLVYLGRSLFTDYLLAVELGGTLLLIATVGAIVIASRRPGPPPGANGQAARTGAPRETVS